MVQSTGDGQPQTGDLNGIELVARALDEPALPETPEGTTRDGADSSSEEPRQPRTYSEQEWNSRQSALDKQVAEANARTSRLLLDVQGERQEAMERSARLEDERMVEEGDLTRNEANQRMTARSQSVRAATDMRQREENVLRMEAHGEEVGRLTAAQDMALKYGVDARVLLEDESLTDPDKMEIKAERLSLEREREELAAAKRGNAPQERFDGGGGSPGSSTGVVADMSAQEKIRYALDHPPRGNGRNRSR